MLISIKLIPKLKFSGITLILILSIFQIKQLVTNIQTSDIYYIDCDPVFSLEMRDQIIDYINQNIKRKNPSEFYKILKTRFPLIKSVILHKKYPDIMTAKIFGQKPIYKINDQMAFTQNGELHLKNLFAFNYIENLDNINNFQDESENIFLNFLTNLTSEITKDYQINWHHKNLIQLINKGDRNYSALIKHDKIPEIKILKLCNKINCQKKKNKQITTDLRFDNQIIVSRI